MEDEATHFSFVVAMTMFLIFKLQKEALKIETKFNGFTFYCFTEKLKLSTINWRIVDNDKD